MADSEGLDFDSVAIRVLQDRQDETMMACCRNQSSPRKARRPELNLDNPPSFHRA